MNFDVRCQKAQSLIKNANNSLTGASASSVVLLIKPQRVSNPMRREWKVRGSKGSRPLLQQKGQDQVPQVHGWHQRPHNNCFLQEEVCIRHRADVQRLYYNVMHNRYKANLYLYRARILGNCLILTRRSSIEQQRFEPRAQKCVVDCRTQCMAF